MSTPRPPRPKAPAPLAIGSRAIVTTPDGGDAVLTQRDGNTSIASVPAGIEVMISAWLPPRDGGTLYFVTAAGAGPQGWIGPEHLVAVVRPRVPKPVVVAPVKAPPARARKQPIGAAAVAPKAAKPTKRGR